MCYEMVIKNYSWDLLAFKKWKQIQMKPIKEFIRIFL